MREVICEQQGDLWKSLRRGRPTASQFKNIITAKKGDLSTACDGYIATLIAESLGWEQTFKGNYHTERGNNMEDEAFRWLKFKFGQPTRKAGICLSDCARYAASPDGFMGDDTVLEIKNPDVNTMVLWKMDGGLPLDHRVQVHGQLAVTGKDRAVFLAYSPHEAIDHLAVEVIPDDFTKRVRDSVERFCDLLTEARNQVLGEEAEFYQPTIPTDQPA